MFALYQFILPSAHPTQPQFRYTCTHTHTYICTHTCTYTCMHTRMHTHAHARAHTHTHACTHADTLFHSLSSLCAKDNIFCVEMELYSCPSHLMSSLPSFTPVNVQMRHLCAFSHKHVKASWKQIDISSNEIV